MSAPEIPETMRLEAVNVLGLPVSLVEDTWHRHCAWVDANVPGSGYGGIPWHKLVRKVVAELRLAEQGQTRDELRAQHRARNAKRAAEAKAAADAEYEKFGVTFGEYVEALREEELDQGLELPSHEATLARANVPRSAEGERVLAFLNQLFSRQTGDRKTSRVTACACGAEAQSWVQDGKVYRSAKCQRCSDAEARDKRVAAGESPSVAQSEVPR